MSDPGIFEAHCLALGRLCVAWATVDRQLNDLLSALIGCSPAATACITTTVDGVAARCDIMGRLAYENPVSDEWPSLFVRLLTNVNVLAGKRNRYVHDFWGYTRGTLVRMDRRAFAKRPQSRQPVQLTYDAEHVTPPGEVDRLTEEIGKTAFILHAALRDLKDWRGPHRFRVSPPLLQRAFDLADVPDVLRWRFDAPDARGA